MTLFGLRSSLVATFARRTSQMTSLTVEESDDPDYPQCYYIAVTIDGTPHQYWITHEVWHDPYYNQNDLIDGIVGHLMWETETRDL